MIAEGLAAGVPPEATFPPGWEAHHIVPRGDNRFAEATEARELLERFGIDINDPVNGVALPRAFHQGVHTRPVYTAVRDALLAAPTRGAAEGALRGIADELAARAAEALARPSGTDGGG
jgi:hypothetical protein